MGVRTWPSATNFLLIGLGDRDAHEVRSRMKARGVGVRAFPDLPVAGSAIRLTLGPAVVNDRVLAVLEEVLA
ncbi:MAG: hypothetical protein GWM90_08845 [Gemmatimonadetes bacterium]|nr:hypothetical protein [Gemmatimonadota bacterium]NIQ54001.1 hypothetical protein [Gemmatimonadota bacterium]NIU74185.1 hypothetical protein [Gammaproteobacteria bacterium]NIX44216.1 hypothetical protein [Gemmatimonadota bacterium]